jgi:predicted phosphodiesterase
VQAIISDIHGNLEALEVVLSDIKKHGATEIICVGDVVGYGPNPKECLDYARRFDVTIQGNHEQALLVQMQGASFNLRAKNSIEWTRDQFNMLGEEREENSRRWDFLGALDETYARNGLLFVHGTPREPISEYLYPRDIYRPEKLKELFDMIEWICFVGHTHVPGIWTEDMIYLTPEEVNYRYRIGRKKTIINVGSVGQPRDSDPRACYVLLDQDTVLFRKLSYPVQVTIEKIQRITELDPFLADRLREGR